MAEPFLRSSLSPAIHLAFTSLPQASETVINLPHCSEYNLHLIVLIITRQSLFVPMSSLSYFSTSATSLDEF